METTQRRRTPRGAPVGTCYSAAPGLSERSHGRRRGLHRNRRPVLGDDVSLKINSAVTNTDRTYPSLSATEKDALPARIWLGIHFRDAMDDGLQPRPPHRKAGQERARLIPMPWPPASSRVDAGGQAL